MPIGRPRRRLTWKRPGPGKPGRRENFLVAYFFDDLPPFVSLASLPVLAPLASLPPADFPPDVDALAMLLSLSTDSESANRTLTAKGNLRKEI